MNNSLKFKVEVKELEDKISREIEISKESSIADLAYAILTSFDCHEKEFYVIDCDGTRYDSIKPLYNNDQYKSAITIRLKDLNLKNKTMFMNYNPKQKLTFKITCLGESIESLEYPKITKGIGKAIAYVDTKELKQIVEETDKTGKSNYSIIIETDGIEEESFFDYRDFDLEEHNLLFPINFDLMKEEYENTTLADVLRIVRENKYLFVKMDTYEIVNPHDYIKKYIPSNYNKLNSEEKDKIKIPQYEDLNIYELPTYKEINHKEIMSKYVKKYVSNKEVRQKLFYTLRNYDYMDKFYNILRDYGLFNEYEMLTNNYYEKILKNWQEAKNIKE